MRTSRRFLTRPLYLQVRDALADRIVRHQWQAGAALPNEVELSRELEVSQGTLRKALEELEAEQLVTRRQGRGTFVNDLDSAEAARRFCNLCASDGHRLTGEIRQLDMVVAPASEDECHKLELEPNQSVIRVRRICFNGGKPFMLEETSMPESQFPELAQQAQIPPTISGLAHQYGLLLGGAEERVTIANANAEVAEALAIELDEPVLHLDRVIHSIDGPPIQWRLAHCHLDGGFYLAEKASNGRRRKQLA